jgi:hypothetical protein
MFEARRARPSIGWLVALAFALPAAADEPAPAADAQQRFASPQAAGEALVAAARAGDAKALLAVLGPEADRLLHSGDEVADRAALERFAAAYEAGHALENSGDARAVLAVGEDRWPLPIPIVKDRAGWRFDTPAGEEELLARRIGRNELSAIQACLAYADAQREYYLRDPDGDGLLQYAQRFASAPGQRDGLYWEAGPDEAPSPLGPLFASAKEEGYAVGTGKGEPFHGYRFRILTAQGPKAPGGAYDYEAGGKMIGGFAMLAQPASYGSSGVMSFLVSHDGVVYQKDLGPETDKAAAAITRFDPDDTWEAVDAADEEQPETAASGE